MENQALIEAKIKELERESPRKEWYAIEGNFALTKFDFNYGNPIFSPTNGIPVKIFASRKTGEMRMFPAILFRGL